MNTINDLIERIGMINVESVPGGTWSQIDFALSSVVSYSESNSFFLKDGARTDFAARVRNDRGKNEYAASLALQLREAMYHVSPQKGAWFSMRMVIKSDGDFNVDFDYETKPQFSIEIDDLDFVKDYQRFPRDKAIMPLWLSDMLTAHKIV